MLLWRIHTSYLLLILLAAPQQDIDKDVWKQINCHFIVIFHHNTAAIKNFSGKIMSHLQENTSSRSIITNTQILNRCLFLTITKVFDGTEFKVLVSYRKFIKLKPATWMPDGSFYYVYELLIPQKDRQTLLTHCTSVFHTTVNLQWPLEKKKKKGWESTTSLSLYPALKNMKKLGSYKDNQFIFIWNRKKQPHLLS